MPTNYILLTIWTLCESVLIAYLCAIVRSPEIVLTATIMTAALVLGLMFYAFTSDEDFTVCGGTFFSLGVLLFVTGIMSIFMGRQFYLLYCFLGVFLFGLYLIFDI